MILTKNKYRALAGEMIDDYEFQLFIEKVVYALDSLIDLESVLVKESDYVEKYKELPYDFEDFQLDKVSDMSTFLVDDVIINLTLKSAFKHGALRLRFSSAYNYLQEIIKSCEYHSDMFVPLTKKEVKSLHSLVSSCISEYLFGLFYQFGLDETYADVVDNKSDIRLNTSFDKFMKSDFMPLTPIIKNMLKNPKTLVESFKKLLKEYKPVMTIFEEYPELEEPFFDIVGSYAMDFSEIEDQLTLENIKYIISIDDMNDDTFKEIKASLGKSSTTNSCLNKLL